MNTDERLTALADVAHQVDQTERELVGLISTRNRMILDLINEPGMTLDRVAIKAGISATRVVQIRRRGANLLL
jgi:DNA-directed RNA polymerase specialized sigma subunit